MKYNHGNTDILMMNRKHLSTSKDLLLNQYHSNARRKIYIYLSLSLSPRLVNKDQNRLQGHVSVI